MNFGDSVLNWFSQHGRTDLPWQENPTPYRVWVSEIMLQQTQVATVIPYYQRFLRRFPDAGRLAGAPLDQVLSLWAGLGYYARARNLHRAAILVRDDHAGELPHDIELLNALPGIGRSTAGAILALSSGQRHAILDGNVKRVLTRYHGVTGWPGEGTVERKLWALAEKHTPVKSLARYTQAIMDLGATVCTRVHPVCHRCPLAADCVAHAQGRETDYPTPKPHQTLPVRSAILLMLRNERGETLLEQRPQTGIWGGLWSLPEYPHNATKNDLRDGSLQRFGCLLSHIEYWPVLRHSFSHFHLDITPVSARAKSSSSCVMEPGSAVWYNMDALAACGVATPVKKLLVSLTAKHRSRHDPYGILRQTRQAGRRHEISTLPGGTRQENF
jgi:A/G-specific adenine glycosylase